ncbi:hypothetical protein [Natrinema salsiterrestre]|uniref:DUF7974 domain-containing protein n=1 Tax=Natrinema salsiterrestre TaxID=2950540 RepID=A0A9Q4L0R2_9EURY|nr:hypothetical protein [Natrinema salsiterrestre]MDF9747728.1 hypothetical protein [Natrinema salsiterrestre]
MRRSQPERDTGGDSNDEFGADPDGSRPSVVSLFTALIPPAVARRAIAASVTTDRDVYERDEPVEITVAFENRLPIPVELPTPRQRRWGWTIDGHLEASDERLYTRDRPATFDFRGGERKRLSVTWNGRLERVRNEGRRESVVPEPGEYEIRAFVATDETASRPSDSTTIRLE